MADTTGGRTVRRYAVTVSGRVQGVGFRFFTREWAHAYGLTGWVRNDPGGSVSMEVQGTEERIAAFLEQLRQGPLMSKVTAIKQNEIPRLDGESDFIIRFG